MSVISGTVLAAAPSAEFLDSMLLSLSAMALEASESSTSFAELVVDVVAMVSFRLGIVGRDGEAVRVTEAVADPALGGEESSVKVTVAVAVLVDSSGVEGLETFVSSPVPMLITTSAPSTSFCGDVAGLAILP